MASGGYPKSYEKGYVIQGLAEAKDNAALVFHAGTAWKDDAIVTNGGRVLGVVAKAENVRSAVERAYENVQKISFDKVHFRKDIAYRALHRK